MKNKPVLCCIHQDPVTHEAVKDAFHGYRHYRLQSVEGDLDALARNTKARLGNIDIALLELPENPTDVARTVEKARGLMPDAAIVLLVTTMTPATIARSFAEGAAGCLDRRVDLAFLPIYCDLVQHGIPVYPAMLAEIIRHYNHWFEDLAYPPMEHTLSRREIEVLEYVALGEANKLIARHLGIVEATVKVHLRTIMRKLGVDNRTQAVLRGMQYGIVKGGLTATSTGSRDKVD